MVVANTYQVPEIFLGAEEILFKSFQIPLESESNRDSKSSAPAHKTETLALQLPSSLTESVQQRGILFHPLSLPRHGHCHRTAHERGCRTTAGRRPVPQITAMVTTSMQTGSELNSSQFYFFQGRKKTTCIVTHGCVQERMLHVASQNSVTIHRHGHALVKPPKTMGPRKDCYWHAMTKFPESLSNTIVYLYRWCTTDNFFCQ